MQGKGTHDVRRASVHLIRRNVPRGISKGVMGKPSPASTAVLPALKTVFEIRLHMLGRCIHWFVAERIGESGKQPAGASIRQRNDQLPHSPMIQPVPLHSQVEYYAICRAARASISGYLHA